MSRSIPFVSFRQVRKNAAYRLAQHVDASALYNLVCTLETRGYSPGHLLLNFPTHLSKQPKPSFEGVGLLPDDVIVTATRMDLTKHPEDLDCRKKVVRGETQLEDVIESAWKRVLLDSRRLQVVVQPNARNGFSAGYESRSNIVFAEADHARYRAFPHKTGGRLPRKSPTAGYVLRLRELWPGGPGYFGAFGMNGTIGLVLSQLIRTRSDLAEVIDREGFYLIEMSGDVPPRPIDLSFVRDWKADVILRAPAFPEV